MTPKRTESATPSAKKPVLEVMLCSPRGFCAGVVRAIETVERALALYGTPVYVRHEIVHNRYVVDSLRAKGAVFVEELDEIPDTSAPVVFSAHGVPKSVPEEASRRNFFAIDATCPLVTKVHREAEIHHPPRPRDHADRPCRPPRGDRHHGPAAARRGAPVETVEEAATFVPKDAGKLAYVTQTTLSVDDTAEIVAVLKERFPDDRRAAQGRHLLRHHQPPGGGQAGGADGRRHDRGRLAQLVELAAAQGGRRAQRLPLRGAAAARRGHRLGAARRPSSSSASRRAPRRRRCWSRRSSTPSPSATRCSVETVTAVEEDGLLPAAARRCASGEAAE